MSTKLTPLTSESDIRHARSTLIATLCRHATTFTRFIGWQGGGGTYPVYWSAREGFWFSPEAYPDEARWVNFFGTEDPALRTSLTIVCEINPPKKGENKRCAGLVVRDDQGAIYFTHSGKIGGGRKGIGKNAFLSHYRGARESVTWANGKQSEFIVIGRIDGDRFPAHVGNFVREVRRFKAAASGRAALSELPAQPQADTQPGFNPEFAGQRRGYKRPSEIESRCDHGLIINALANALASMDHRVGNDRNRDLFVLDQDGRVKFLFEAKTEVTTSSVYEAIGQLLYHSALQSPPPVRVMVLPAEPSPATRRALEALDIKTLVFDWHDNHPIFRNLAATCS